MVRARGIHIVADHVIVVVYAEKRRVRPIPFGVVVTGEGAAILDEAMSVPGSVGVQSDNDAGVVYAGSYHAYSIKAGRETNGCEGRGSYVEQVSMIIAGSISVKTCGYVAIVYG